MSPSRTLQARSSQSLRVCGGDAKIMNKLLNSAMAPRLDLRYDFEPLSAEHFARILRTEKFESFIGYPETARILEELAGVNIPVSRNQTTVEPGDKLLVARLKYRMASPSQKGQTQHSIAGFEFAIGHVSRWR